MRVVVIPFDTRIECKCKCVFEFDYTDIETIEGVTRENLLTCVRCPFCKRLFVLEDEHSTVD